MTIQKKMQTLLLIVILLFIGIRMDPSAVTIYNTDVSAPTSGNVFVGVKGSYENVSTATILKRINAIRQEAYKEGIVSQYIPIKWSADLEWMAQVRAAEARIQWGHNRPNGDFCFGISHGGVSTSGECLAWNWSGLMMGIDQWYDEKDDLVNNTGGVTGHYEALIDPSYSYIGIGSFTNDGRTFIVAAEFCGGATKLNEGRSGMKGACIQKVEVPRSSVGPLKISGASTLAAGKTASYSLSMPITLNEESSTVVPTEKVTYTSSNPAVASISSAGKVTAKKPGKTTITATAGGTKKTKTLTVKPPAKGTKLQKAPFTYRVYRKGAEVEVLKYNKAAASAVIPETVTIYGTKYKVTRIAAKAFSGKKMLKKVTIGKNISYIGKKAFAKCAKLKRIIIRTKKLKASKVGAAAFKGIHKKAVFKVPGSCLRSYKSILRKKGAGKKTVFKK